MERKLYVITRYLTYPGTMVRGFLEQLTLRLCKIPVEDNRIMRKNELSGHVEHELAPTIRKAFTVCFLPAFLVSIISFLMFMFPLWCAYLLQMSGVTNIIMAVICSYLALSLHSNRFPIYEDVLNLKDLLYKQKKHTPSKIIFAPGYVCIKLGSFLERNGVTFIFGLLALIAFVALSLCL